jgi:hypothetical protein
VPQSQSINNVAAGTQGAGRTPFGGGPQSGRTTGPNQANGGGFIATSGGASRVSGSGSLPYNRRTVIQAPEGINQNTRAHAIYDRRQRSSYGIHNSFDRPVGPTPWPVRFINALSERTTAIRMRYWSQSNTGQIPGIADGYANKLQTQWRRGSASGGTRADPIVQNAQIPTIAPNYPHHIGAFGLGSHPTSPYLMDPRDPGLVNGRKPMFLPRYEGGQIRLKSETSQRAGEYLPTRFSVVPPMRIVRMHRYGTGMMGGPSQFGWPQTWGQYQDGGCIVISPVQTQLGMKSRQIRSVRGVLSPKGGTGRERIPAVFTPSSVQ